MRVVDEVKARLDIVDFISEYVDLKKAGRNYKGLCPFHTEKTPSFVVFPEDQHWHCFGACATGGDIFTFVMKQESLDFGEALKMLAAKAGVALTPVTPEKIAADERRKLLFELNAAAAQYFHQLLLENPEGARARDYLTSREITTETCTAFKLGYSLDRWDGLKKYLGRTYKQEDLVAVGLLVQREEDRRTYDRFRGRLMFPIYNIKGQVIGFGARTLGEQGPKYLNSPQTAIFDKSSVLYGIHLARQPIRREDAVIIVEGYVDVLRAHQHGMPNMVASMGTALTEKQLKILKRLTQNIILALDADAAGSKGTQRGLDVAHEVLESRAVPVPTGNARFPIRYEGRLNANIKIVPLPPGNDPDKIMRADLAHWQELLQNALPVVDYYFATATANLDLRTPNGKKEAVKRLIPLVRDIGSKIEQAHYVQKLARLVQIDERILWAYLYERRNKKRNVALAAIAAQDEGIGEIPLEDYLLQLLLHKPRLLMILDERFTELNAAPLSVEDFQNSADSEIFRHLREFTQKQQEYKLDSLRAKLPEVLHPHLLHLFTMMQDQPTSSDEQYERDIIACGLRLRERNRKQQIRNFRDILEEAQQSGDSEITIHYGPQIVSYGNEIRRLHHVLANSQL